MVPLRGRNKLEQKSTYNARCSSLHTISIMLEIVVLEFERYNENHIKINGVWCTQSLMQLQRWIRHTAIPRIRINRRLAIAMASHTRLGRASPLGWLDDEMIELVLSKC